MASELPINMRLPATSRHAYLGTELYRRGLPGRAAQEFRLAIADDSSSSDLSNDLAIALAAQGHYDEAVGALQHALSLNPDHPDAARNLALTLRTLRHEEDTFSNAGNAG